MKNIFKIILLLLCFTNLQHVNAAGGIDAGFVNTSIWYGDKSFKEGDTIDIHTAVWNGEDYSISAKVEFMDSDTLLGTRDVAVPKNSLKDVSITWKVTSGDHKISVRISDTEANINGQVQNVSVSGNQEFAKSFFISKALSSGDASGNTITVGDKVAGVVPKVVAKPVAEATNKLDAFRLDTAETLGKLTVDVKNKIEDLNKPKETESKTATTTTTTTTIKNTKPSINEKSAPKEEVKSPVSGIDKPIAYIELFLLTIASFIFTNSIVFYLISAFLAFIILRFIFRKIRR